MCVVCHSVNPPWKVVIPLTIILPIVSPGKIPNEVLAAIGLRAVAPLGELMFSR